MEYIDGDLRLAKPIIRKSLKLREVTPADESVTFASLEAR